MAAIEEFGLHSSEVVWVAAGRERERERVCTGTSRTLSLSWSLIAESDIESLIDALERVVLRPAPSGDVDRVTTVYDLPGTTSPSAETLGATRRVTVLVTTVFWNLPGEAVAGMSEMSLE